MAKYVVKHYYFKDVKPCPFCGGKTSVINGLMMGTLTFICDECGADVMFYGSEHDFEKAKQAWNRRAPDGTNVV